MKRFLLPAGLAVVLHGLLFSMEADWLKRKANSRFRPQPIALTLTCQQPKRIPPQKKLEAIPVYQKNPPPKYPRIARRRGYQGTVMLEVFINREGKVGDLRIFQSSGYPILDKAAMASVRTWVFEPGMRGNEKVEM